MNRVERLALVEREHAELALSVQAELLGLSRASLYYRPVPPSAEEIAIKVVDVQRHQGIRLVRQLPLRYS